MQRLVQRDRRYTPHCDSQRGVGFPWCIESGGGEQRFTKIMRIYYLRPRHWSFETTNSNGKPSQVLNHRRRTLKPVPARKFASPPDKHSRGSQAKNWRVMSGRIRMHEGRSWRCCRSFLLCILFISLPTSWPAFLFASMAGGFGFCGMAVMIFPTERAGDQIGSLGRDRAGAEERQSFEWSKPHGVLLVWEGVGEPQSRRCLPFLFDMGRQADAANIQNRQNGRRRKYAISSTKTWLTEGQAREATVASAKLATVASAKLATVASAKLSRRVASRIARRFRAIGEPLTCSKRSHVRKRNSPQTPGAHPTVPGVQEIMSHFECGDEAETIYKQCRAGSG